MSNLSSVLGLTRDEALKRLNDAGFADVNVCVSGRRREGRPRVIRLKLVDAKPEMVVSYFKELFFENEPAL